MAKKALREQLPPSLQQKVAQSVTGTAPSLTTFSPSITPWKSTRHMEEDKAPPIDDLIGDSQEKDTLRQLIAMQVTINTQKKALEKQLEPVNTRIKALLGSYGVEKMVCDGATVSYFPVERKTIDAMKLLAAGISQDTIDLCTDVSKTRTLVIREAKQ